MQGSPQTMEGWRSAAILLAQHHYTPITATVPPGPMITAEGDERASVRPSVPPSDDSNHLYPPYLSAINPCCFI